MRGWIVAIVFWIEAAVGSEFLAGFGLNLGVGAWGWSCGEAEANTGFGYGIRF